MADKKDLKPSHYKTEGMTVPATASTLHGEIELPQFLAEGGEVTDSDPSLSFNDIGNEPPLVKEVPEEPKSGLMDWLTATKTEPNLRPGGEPVSTDPSLPNTPPAPKAINQDGKNYSFVPGKNGSLTAPAPAPIVPPPAGPLAKSIPPVPGSDLDAQIAAAEKRLGTNPDQRAALLERLQANTRKGQIGAGIAGLGDAIASGGTLGKVNPHAMEKTEEMLAGREATGMQNFKEGQEGLEKAYAAAKAEQGDDPNSAFSKNYAATAEKMLGKYGVKIPAGSSATQIEKMIGPIATVVDASARNTLMANESAHRTAIEQENADTARLGEKNREGELQSNKDKAVMEGSKIPFVGPSHEEKQAAATRLSGGAPTPPPSVPTVNSSTEYAALPPGTHYIDSTGKTKVKK